MQKLPKIFVADIFEGDLNTANGLVKLDANAKIPKVQIPISALDYGLSFYGEVTEVVDETHFKSDDLKGLNDNFFRYYSVYVVRDAAGGGAAPQKERQPVSAYTSSDGTFTHTAFTTPLAVGDEVLILQPYAGEYIDKIYSNLGDFAGQTNLKTLLAVLGSGWDTANKNMYTLLITDLLSHASHGLVALKVLLDNIESKLDTIKGSIGIFYEQADVAVNVNATIGGETNVLNLAVANTRYIVRHLRLKCVDPGVNQVLVRLYELINNVLTNVDTWIIDNTNFGTYFSLMDMFGVPYLAGDQLQITVQASGGGPYAVTGQYSFAKTNV